MSVTWSSPRTKPANLVMRQCMMHVNDLITVVWQAKIETSACLRCYIRVYVVPMSIGLSSSNMPSFHYGHSLAVLSEEFQLLSCVETSLQYILYIGQQSPLVCFVGWPKKKCICIKQSYQVEHSKKLNLSTNIACNERKIIVSWHTNVLWQPRIRIWERSLTLWNKSKFCENVS